jgi:hypothetical protein
MVTDEPSEGEPSSRRTVLLAAGAGLAGAVLAGCGGGASIKQQVHNSQPALTNDVDLLNHLLHLEHVAIAAYTAGIPLLAQPTAPGSSARRGANRSSRRRATRSGIRATARRS